MPTADNTHQVAQRLAPESRVVYADLHDPEAILAAAARTLDLARPRRRYLVIGHAASDLEPEAAGEMTRRNNQTSPVPITPRTRAEVTRFFDGLVGYAGTGRKP